jgi:hypothetical protein
MDVFTMSLTLSGFVRSAFSVTHTTTQLAINNGFYTVMSFDTVKYDLLGEFSKAPNYEFTPKEAGVYHFTAQLFWQFLLATDTSVISFFINGVLVNASDNSDLGVGGDTVNISGDYYLTPSDKLTVRAFWNGGVPGTRDLVANPILSYFMGHRVA